MSNLDEKLKNAEFEPALGPESPHNVLVADRLGLEYDRKKTGLY